MRIKLNSGSIGIEDLESKLMQHFPNYEIKRKSEKHIAVKKSRSLGVNILLKKKSIIVASNFPTLWGQILFILLVFLSLILALLVYLLVFRRKMKKLEKEVSDFLRSAIQPLGASNTASVFDLITDKM